MEKDVVIIGGGAAGYMSAIACARSGGNVTIVERKDRVLKKVLATGNGRCNFTNINATSENYYGQDRDFTKYALDIVSPQEAIDFFEQIGIMHKIEEHGKVYPMSGQASSVVDALRYQAEYLGIEVINNFDVVRIDKVKNGFDLYSKDATMKAEKIIMTTGGKASPDLCSDGSGYKLMKKFDFKVSKLDPVLVQLKTDKEHIRGLQGIKTNAMVYVLSDGNIVGQDYNEILFTDYGISGSAIFNLSYLTALYNDIIIRVDFMHDYEENQLTQILKNRKNNLLYLNMDNFLNGMFNKKIGQVIAKRSGIEKLSFPVSQLGQKDFTKLSYHMKKFDIKVTGTTGFKNAQVTAGGVLTNQFDHKTMESKKIKGLYAAGEIFDIFGECGGYNLQWAWASGYLAGINAAKQ